ncbi:Nif3-like dinuclear metal center hexameric protein [Parvimonas sp. C2]|uniref:Nif3-like dinuclear metal center hexameric protein n=1 Tax=Parvimonas sp. C2 TaxID=3110692 RepID=UPI002B499D35|nr:Nif3-like dinuclear metal center hexameric protein [Parvimonas sp. C2]MEB3072195.1 Nif3-like dinuclear metal center hexameric protein [Parvimonas sp. C2]
MNFKVSDIIELLDTEYSFSLQEDWDNSGFQIGNLEAEVKGILLALDITIDSINCAVSNNINCIITHHPLFFEKIQYLNVNSEYYKKLELLMNNKINVISLHTPLDIHPNGVNKYLADKCLLNNQEVFVDYKDGYGYGIVGSIENDTFKNYLTKLKNNFENPILYFGNIEKSISKVAVLGGSGAFSIKNAISKKVDLLISSDFKYHDIQLALENDLNIIDLGHFESEISGLLSLKEFLINKNSNLEILLYRNNIFKRNIF